MTKTLTTKQAVSWLNAHTNRRIACAVCGAKYSWHSSYFVRRHFVACEHEGDGAWLTEGPIE